MSIRLAIFGPLLVAAVLTGVLGEPTVLALAWFAGGLALWTLIEYLLHRFAFHGFAPHYQHHADSTNTVLLLAPLWLSLSAAMSLWLLFWLTTGSAAKAGLVMAGVIAGYLAYEWLHLRLHGARAGGAWLRALRKHHFYHHFADDRVCYGVTSPIWDRVFRTLPLPNRHDRPAVQPNFR